MSRRRFHPDWNCPACNFRNFGSRERCKNCSNGRRPTGNNNKNKNRNNNNNNNNQNNVAVHGYNNRKPGDWTCTQCQYVNFKSRSQCNKCGAAKPGSSINKKDSQNLLQQAGDWKCNKCSFVNYQNRMKCEKCETAKVDANEKWFKTQFLYSSNEKKEEQTPQVTIFEL